MTNSRDGGDLKDNRKDRREVVAVGKILNNYYVKKTKYVKSK